MRARLVLAGLLIATTASAEPPFARRTGIVVGGESVIASDVPRREPSYAVREERRNIAAVSALVDAFPIDRLSLGGVLNFRYQRATAALAGYARIGYVIGGRRFALWPGVFGGARYRDGPLYGGDLRFVLPISEQILLTFGPRVERDRHETTASFTLGLAAATHDAVPRPTGRARFGHRGMRVFDLQFAATTQPLFRVAMGLDGFLWSGASIGSWASVASDDRGDARVTAYATGARVGQAIIFGDRVWWWGRVGFQLTRADFRVGESPTTTFEALVEMPFIFAIARGVGVAVGPFLALPLLGSHIRKTSLGTASALVFFY